MRVATVVVLLVLVSACTWVDVNERGAEVRVLTQAEAADCKKIGGTTSTSVEKIIGIKRNEEKLAAELLAMARNQAARMQGNAVAPMGPVSGEEQTFGVYLCQ